MPGFTAWYGLTQLGEPQDGETVFVSGAAGAVGSVVAQVARLLGCTVVASAGTEEKLAWLRELGVDAAFSYRERPVGSRCVTRRRTASMCTSTTWGATISKAALGAMRLRGRIVACGSDLALQRHRGAAGPAQSVHGRHEAAQTRGFIISDHYDRFPEFVATIAPSVRDGAVRSARRSSTASRTHLTRSSGCSVGRTSARCSSASTRPRSRPRSPGGGRGRTGPRPHRGFRPPFVVVVVPRTLARSGRGEGRWCDGTRDAQHEERGDQ